MAFILAYIVFICFANLLPFLTLRYVAICTVLPTMSVQEHAGNDKSCVWHARDFADGELKDELFCIRFASVESEWILLFSFSFS